MIPHKRKVTATVEKCPKYPIHVEYLEANVEYWNWTFKIRRILDIGKTEARFEIAVFNKSLWGGITFLHKDCYGNELVIPTMESALNQIEAFIYNELK